MNKNTKAQSVVNLYTEMIKASNEVSEQYTWITSKCHRQGELAGITRKGKNIKGMSLGSFRKYCDLYIDGGHDKVDELRKTIHGEISSIEAEEANQKKPVNKLEEAQRDIDALRRNQAILVKAYNELNSIALDLIVNYNGNTLEYQKHQDLFSSYFGIQLAVNNGK